AESVISTDATLEDVAWGGSTQLAISTRAGTYVVPASGSPYLNLVSRTHGDIDWSANGASITIAEQRDVTVGYNGDPDRGVDRTAHERQRDASGPLPGVYQVQAPREVDAERT